MGVVVYWLSLFGHWGEAEFATLNGVVLGVSLSAGILIFFGTSLLLKTEEALFLFSLIRKRIMGT